MELYETRSAYRHSLSTAPPPSWWLTVIYMSAQKDLTEDSFMTAWEFLLSWCCVRGLQRGGSSKQSLTYVWTLFSISSYVGLCLDALLITIFTSLGALISYSFLGCNSSKHHSIFISLFLISHFFLPSQSVCRQVPWSRIGVAARVLWWALGKD